MSACKPPNPTPPNLTPPAAVKQQPMDVTQEMDAFPHKQEPMFELTTEREMKHLGVAMMFYCQFGVPELPCEHVEGTEGVIWAPKGHKN